MNDNVVPMQGLSVTKRKCPPVQTIKGRMKDLDAKEGILSLI